MRPSHPERGDLYMADLDPVVGHEQGGQRPVLVVSIDQMNQAPADLVIIIPLIDHAVGRASSTCASSPAGVACERVSYAMPEMVRSISTDAIASQDRVAPGTRGRRRWRPAERAS